MEDKQKDLDKQNELTLEENKEIVESKEQVKESKIKTLPMIAIRGRVLLPTTFINFDIGRKISLNALDKTKETGGLVFVATQKDVSIENPKPNDMFEVGAICRVRQVVKPSTTQMVKASVEVLSRAKIINYVSEKDCFMVEVEDYPFTLGDELLIKSALRVAKTAFSEYSSNNPSLSKDMVATLSDIEEPNRFIDNVLTLAMVKEGEKQRILEITDTFSRLENFATLMYNESEIQKVQKKIESRVRKNIDQGQKEYFLREQLKAIHTELGDDEDMKKDYIDAVKGKKLGDNSEEKVLKEITRLDKINPSSPDYSIILNYLDWIKELPFNTYSKDNKDLKKAQQILDDDHFGLEKVKDRIVEYLAVLHLTKKLKGPILCFVGPPGVGKTSIASSIARATGRKFVRMSLGGVKDEAEIRGHRRTYVGAMPGRIIYGLKQAGTANPVFLLDEIDKLSADIHGDPASALLEVLDPEQNSTFRDRFLEIPFDLSKVMFITTANSVETIPVPLLDRMEVIRLDGYTELEKLEIGIRYLVPKAVKENGLKDGDVVFTKDAILEIINGYTLEAGVRNLEREIFGIVRKIAKGFALKEFNETQTIDENRVKDLLGNKRMPKDIALENDEVGACTGLAWTAFGGTTLTIEVSLMHGKGEIILTGKLGDVMKESARAAISFIRAHADKYNIDDAIFDKTDIHIHVPEGATPKDGPSAGVTIATAILSALTKRKVKKSVAMTGEITLRGKVLAIGGLKEKALAGFRVGVSTIIVPKANELDLIDMPKEIKEKINFVTVSNVDEVFEVALENL